MAFTPFRFDVFITIKAIADEGKAIIIGRAGQVILANRPDVLHIRVTAPLERRVRSIMVREEMSESNARAYILRKDRDCSRYHRTEYDRDVHDSRLYDLVINSELLDSERFVNLTCKVLADRQQQLIARLITERLAATGASAGWDSILVPLSID